MWVAGVKDNHIVGGEGGVAFFVYFVGDDHWVGVRVRCERKAESEWYSKELRVRWK